MDKQLAGQPLWLWGLGAVIVVGGYLYFKSHSSSSAQQPAPGGGGKSTSTSTFHETITNLQQPPSPGKKKTKGA
jgi:hypothetical protein